jgi:hypothetical protein
MKRWNRNLGGALGLIVAFALTGCGSGQPDVDQVTRTLARSDSLKRNQRDRRSPQSWEGYPVAASADSDSVTWLNGSPHAHGFVQ